jgi:hypothetical protein
MANVKISALPTTATTTLDDYFVINDALLTTTSKIQLKNFAGMTNINGNNAIQSASYLTNLGTTANTESAIAIGNGAEATSPYSIAIGTRALNSNRDGTRDYYIAIGYEAQSITEGVAIGKDARCLATAGFAIGNQTRVFGNGGFALGNQAESYSNNGIAIGAFSEDQSSQNGFALGVNSINFGDDSIAFGVNAITNSGSSISMGAEAATNAIQTIAIGALSRATAPNAVAIGYSARSNHEGAYVFGDEFSSLYSATTHSKNTYTEGVKSYNVINAGAVSGSIDVDLSLGTLYFFEITGNTTPNFINWREGQQIQFWVKNQSNYDVPTATISGGGSVFAKAGVINPTNNAVSGYYGTIVNGDLYLDEHLNFQAV